MSAPKDMGGTMLWYWSTCDCFDGDVERWEVSQSKRVGVTLVSDMDRKVLVLSSETTIEQK